MHDMMCEFACAVTMRSGNECERPEDNQFEIVEELICFRSFLHDKHLHCHDIRILIPDNQVSNH